MLDHLHAGLVLVLGVFLDTVIVLAVLQTKAILALRLDGLIHQEAIAATAEVLTEMSALCMVIGLTTHTTLCVLALLFHRHG